MAKKGEISNPHDKFFKAIFSRREEVISFLKGTLPEEIIRKIKQDSIQPAGTSYVTKELRESMSDIVYQADFDNFPIKLAFIIEHKSYIPQFPFLQFLLYFVNCINEQIKQQKKGEAVEIALPIIIVVYHGEKAWEIKPIWEYFGDVPFELRRFIPVFNYLLVNLTNDSYEKIKASYDSLILQMSLMTMKGVFDTKAFEKSLYVVFSGLPDILSTEEGFYLFETIIVYLFDQVELDHEKITKTVNEITTKGGGKVMTIANRLIEKGLQKGRQEGMQKGRQEGIQKGRQEGMQKGRQEGMQKGRQEGLEIGKLIQAVETVIGLQKTDSFPLNEIATFTKLSVQKVEQIVSLFKIHGENILSYLEETDFKELR
jgi:predicted transposase/invertase (TIGR01784 family)